MSDTDALSGNNFYYADNINNEFSRDFFDHFNQIIREFSMQSNIMNNIYQPAEVTNEANIFEEFYE